MALQRVFKTSYIEELSQRINVKEYMQEKFPYDETRCAKLYGIDHPEGLLERLDPTPEGDLQSAIAIYEAYKNLSPLVAQQDNLWVYLTHVDLFDYVKRRWPIAVDEDKDSAKNFISSHWFRNSKHLFRTSVAGLWWQVHLTKDETREDPYELTKVYFSCGQDFHMRFGELILIRHRDAMIGVLDFLKEHSNLYTNNFDPKGQYISQLFNTIGGFKQLAYMNPEYFKSVLDNKYYDIENITHRNDVQNKTINI